MSNTIRLDIVEGNILDFKADLLAFKYAAGFHGADLRLAMFLNERGLLNEKAYRVARGQYDLIDTQRSDLPANWVMFVGTGPLRQIGYDEIEQLAIDVLRVSAEATPFVRSIAMTCHGPGFGLDETTSINAQVRGYVKALQAGKYPPGLQRITVVEHNAKRAARLVQAINASDISATLVRSMDPAVFTVTLPQAPQPDRDEEPALKRETSMSATSGAIDATSLAGLVADQAMYAKPHAFVAMPFHQGMDDVFFYGIQQPVHRLGLLCERADFDQFTGDVMSYVRERIEKAAVIIADLTGANANVYLEVGYAWGKERPTVLLVNDEKDLLFDVKGQRCLVYRSSIRTLEQMLDKELSGLVSKGVVQVNLPS
jgi:hypothetical protein